MENKKDFCNPDICKACGGQCCALPGAYSVEDFDHVIDYDFLKSLFETGKYSVDWWFGKLNRDEDDCFNYFIRPRNTNSEIVDEDNQYESSVVNPKIHCIHLTDTGCSLTFENRPRGCRRLIPAEDYCTTDFGKKEVALNWYPYREIIATLANEFKSADNPNIYAVNACRYT